MAVNSCPANTPADVLVGLVALSAKTPGVPPAGRNLFIAMAVVKVTALPPVKELLPSVILARKHLSRRHAGETLLVFIVAIIVGHDNILCPLHAAP